MSRLIPRVAALAARNPTMREHLQPFLRVGGWAGGSYGGTLSPITLEQGQGVRLVGAGETLHGWDKYIQLVAEDMASSPSATPAGHKAYSALLDHTLRVYAELRVHLTVEEVADDPYQTAKELADDVSKNHRMKIWTAYSEGGTNFTHKEFLMFRVVHDAIGHAFGNQTRAFSMKGELQAFNKHQAEIGCQGAALAAYFTEIIGKNCHHWHFGDWPPTGKVVTLPRFDECRLGSVVGYQIKDQDLV